jgi:hypothetical protein
LVPEGFDPFLFLSFFHFEVGAAEAILFVARLARAVRNLLERLIIIKIVFFFFLARVGFGAAKYLAEHIRLVFADMLLLQKCGCLGLIRLLVIVNLVVVDDVVFVRLNLLRFTCC